MLRGQIEEVVSAFFKQEMKNTIGSMWSLWVSLDCPIDSHISHLAHPKMSFLHLLANNDDLNGDGIWRPDELMRSRKQRAA